MADSMADDVKACPSNLRILTVAVLLGANLFVLVLAAVSLYQSRQQYELRAQLVTRDMVRSVDQRISGSIGHIDLALQAVADELERQLQGGGWTLKPSAACWSATSNACLKWRRSGSPMPGGG